MIRKKVAQSGRTVRVTFELPGDAAKDSVHVVGEFNDWDESATPMKYVKTRNVWSTGVTLKPNASYQFRYLVDGSEWRNDDAADGRAPSPYFSENSVLNL